MSRSGGWRLLVAGGAAVVAVALTVLGAAADSPPAGSGGAPAARQAAGQRFTFGVWGDMPYARAGDDPKIQPLIDHMNASPIAFSAFIGDLKDGSSLCDDDQFSAAIDRFNRFKAPMVYVPGDNEWTDCHRLNNGGYNNLERLDFLRRTMFPRPESYGQTTMLLEHQGRVGEAYAENTRWTYGDVAFVGVNVPGSNNNKVNSPDECAYLSARTDDDCDADNVEYAERDTANISWVQDSFRLAKERGSRGVVIFMQADPGFDLPETLAVERDDPIYDGYTAFLYTLATETQAFSGQVLLVHGDTHFFKIDKPLLDQAHMIPNFTRLEAFGSPNIHWVQVTVDPSDPLLFAFRPMYVPGN